MADGLNQARAMRIAEIMSDFRNIMNYISNIRAQPSPEDYNEEGYVVLRQCVTQAQALLSLPFEADGSRTGDSEQEKTLLKRIITDAAVRRFQVQQLYMRTTAALRWVNSRSAVLQGGRPTSQNEQRLRMVTNTFRQELGQLDNRRAFEMLRMRDQAEGKWLAEDPSLDELVRQITASAANRR